MPSLQHLFNACEHFGLQNEWNCDEKNRHSHFQRRQPVD
jgi:hypothetical protein